MKKTAIIHGSSINDAGKKAVEILSKILLDYTFSYPECFCGDDIPDLSQYIPFFIGTKESNPMITEKNTSSPEEYSITVKDNSVTIEGFDERGVLYGCVDFYNKYLLPNEPKDTFSPYHFNPFENDLPECILNSAPSVKDRGIWTWGHVIYDYRNFLDNMLMLKMNTLIMWNDCVPFNAKEIIDYAHLCGIKVIWGYSWGWDTSFNKFPIERVHEFIKPVFEKFEREYVPLNPDGIYFQSFTEIFDSDSINGVLIADAVTDFVNSTASQFFDKYPKLELQFGLHSDSVREKTEFIKNVDRRIRIVWKTAVLFRSIPLQAVRIILKKPWILYQKLPISVVRMTPLGL